MKEVKQIKKEYDLMLKNGDLLEMFPHATGVWDKDKDFFIQMFNSNILIQE